MINCQSDGRIINNYNKYRLLHRHTNQYDGLPTRRERDVESTLVPRGFHVATRVLALLPGAPSSTNPTRRYPCLHSFFLIKTYEKCVQIVLQACIPPSLCWSAHAYQRSELHRSVCDGTSPVRIFRYITNNQKAWGELCPGRCWSFVEIDWSKIARPRFQMCVCVCVCRECKMMRVQRTRARTPQVCWKTKIAARCSPPSRLNPRGSGTKLQSTEKRRKSATRDQSQFETDCSLSLWLSHTVRREQIAYVFPLGSDLWAIREGSVLLPSSCILPLPRINFYIHLNLFDFRCSPLKSFTAVVA